VLTSSPEKLGIFLVAFESDDLQADIARVKEKGFKVLSGPVEIQSNLHGKIKAAHVEGPSNIRAERPEKIERSEAVSRQQMIGRFEAVGRPISN
jgi:hypothetical protein